MIEFGDTSIITLYIKQLLKDFNLPTCQAWTKGMKVYKDAFYIYENKVLRAKETGNFDVTSVDKFKIVFDNYKFGRAIPNLTKNFVLSNLNYDTYTHEYLGKYLRFVRDYRGIDLMPLYNCFSGKEVTNLKINYNGNVIFKTEEGYKVFMIDIVPFKEYSIFVDAPGKVDLVAGYYNNGLINIFENVDEESSSYIFPYQSTLLSKVNPSFNKPFVYDKLMSQNMTSDVWRNIVSPITYNQRDNLKLFIKVPFATQTSSIVVLEGNYLENNKYHFNEQDTYTLLATKPSDFDTNYSNYYSRVNNKYVKLTEAVPFVANTYYKIVVIKGRELEVKDMISAIPYEDGEPINVLDYDQSADKPFITKVGLTKVQSQISHPFSTRLIEYLINNTIVPFDTIDTNIIRVQENLYTRSKSESKLYKIKFKGEWDNAIRNTILGIAKKKNLINSKYDLLGYVDKDIEETISLED